VIVRRLMNLTGEMPVLAGTDESFPAVAAARGISAEPLPEINRADRRREENGALCS
jgi:hypothetical protein